jgi:DNA-binding GntR family transcriptional regulator
MSRLGELASLEPNRKPSLVDDAYLALKEAIRDNLFPPGYQGSEQEIAIRLGMSRTPVHEAIIRLQEDGLVRVLAKRGIIVCALSPEDIDEIYDVVIALEPRAAELLAALPVARRTAIIAELSALNAAMAQALGRDDLNAWARADERFHQTLVERCGNKRIARFAQTIMDQSHRARMFTLKLRPKPQASLAEHAEIIAAVESGDSERAGRSARAHRFKARAALLPLLATFGMKHL